MSYSEIYTRIHWEDEPDTSTPLDKDNLNHMDAALKAFDLLIKEIGNNAMVAADVANCLFGQPTIDQSTGVITFPKKDGGSYTLDTLLEKVIVNFDFDETTQIMTITLEDGTTKTVNLSSFITETEFDDSSTIDFSQSNHHVTAVVKAHSIGPDQLQQDYLADCETAADSAEDAADDASADALKAEGHAVGKQNGVDVDSSSPYYHNNAKYYKEQAEAIAGNTFGGLSDVNFNNLQDDDIPAYNGTTQMWENKPQSKGVLPHVIVISDAGSTVTLTKGAKVVTATETSTGHFEADVDEYGTWTIDSILGGDDAQVSLVVDNVKIYTVDDSHFHADISVTYPGIATQCSLSASGQTTLYATGSPYTFTVHEAGTYTLSVTCRGVTRTETYSVTATGQTFSKDFTVIGATVTPINDVATWLDCAYLWDKNYALLADVIGDSEALLALISDNNAVDYMVRSYGFANSICADPLAMLYIGQYNYCANKLLDRNRNLAIYHYFETTKGSSGITFTDSGNGEIVVSGTASSAVAFYCSSDGIGGQLTLKAGTYIVSGCPVGGAEETYCIRVRHSSGSIVDCKEVGNGATITFSSDTLVELGIIVYSGVSFPVGGVTFKPMIRLATDTDDTWEPYLPWTKAIGESEYFELVLANQVPVMTSDTTPSGRVIYDGKPTLTPIPEPYYVFDGDKRTVGSAGGVDGSYLGYIFSSSKHIYAIAGGLCANTNAAWAMTAKFQYTTDGTTWSDVPNSSLSLSGTGAIDINFSNVVCDLECTGIRAIYVTTANARISSHGLQFCGRNDVTPPVSRTLKSFATAANEEILEMVCKADRGEINLFDDAGWRVGQEHSISISAIPTTDGVNYTVGESQPAQTATIVLSNHVGVELVNSVLDKQGQTRTQCSFEYDWKEMMENGGGMNLSNTNSGSWDSCARRKWCNYGLRNAVSPYIRAASKQFKTITATEYNSSVNKVSNDYFALRASKEVQGSNDTGANVTESAALTQAEYYQTAANKQKRYPNGANPANWWMRSPQTTNTTNFMSTAGNGGNNSGQAVGTFGFAPFGAF